MVESQPSKLLVAGSIPVSRSRKAVVSIWYLVFGFVWKGADSCEGAIASLQLRYCRKHMAYQQAQIAVTKTEDFEQLKSALERIFSSAALEKFYSKLQSRTVYAREFEKIVERGILESVDSGLAKSGKTAKQLYGALGF